jgi:hypothetical protein
MKTGAERYPSTINLHRAANQSTGLWDTHTDPTVAYLISAGTVVAQVAADTGGYVLRFNPNRPGVTVWPTVGRFDTARQAVAAADARFPNTARPEVAMPTGVDFPTGTPAVEVVKHAIRNGRATVACPSGVDQAQIRSFRNSVRAYVSRAGQTCSVITDRQAGTITVTITITLKMAA